MARFVLLGAAALVQAAELISRSGVVSSYFDDDTVLLYPDFDARGAKAKQAPMPITQVSSIPPAPSGSEVGGSSAQSGALSAEPPLSCLQEDPAKQVSSGIIVARKRTSSNPTGDSPLQPLDLCETLRKLLQQNDVSGALKVVSSLTSSVDPLLMCGPFVKNAAHLLSFSAWVRDNQGDKADQYLYNLATLDVSADLLRTCYGELEKEASKTRPVNVLGSLRVAFCEGDIPAFNKLYDVFRFHKGRDASLKDIFLPGAMDILHKSPMEDPSKPPRSIFSKTMAAIANTCGFPLPRKKSTPDTIATAKHSIMLYLLREGDLSILSHVIEKIREDASTAPSSSQHKNEAVLVSLNRLHEHRRSLADGTAMTRIDQQRLVGQADPLSTALATSEAGGRLRASLVEQVNPLLAILLLFVMVMMVRLASGSS